MNDGTSLHTHFYVIYLCKVAVYSSFLWNSWTHELQLAIQYVSLGDILVCVMQSAYHHLLLTPSEKAVTSYKSRRRPILPLPKSSWLKPCLTFWIVVCISLFTSSVSNVSILHFSSPKKGLLALLMLGKYLMQQNNVLQYKMYPFDSYSLVWKDDNVLYCVICYLGTD